MRIGLIAENYYPTLGGIQEHIYHLAHWLVGQGHQIKIITGDPQVGEHLGPADDPWVVRVGRSRQYGVMGTYSQATLGPMIAHRFYRCLQENQFDLLHLHGPCDIGIPLLAHTFFRGPMVGTLHSAFDHSLSRALMAPYYKWVLKNLTGVIAVSELAAEVMRRYADFKYRVIANGVDVAAFKQGKKMERFNDGLQNILYIGRIEPRNGLDVLIRAFPQILKENPRARLLIAGGGPEDREYKSLVPNDLKSRVVFLGPVYKERADLYASADLFVLPARKGGTFSIMILEALAAGVPIVSTPFVPPQLRNSHWSSVNVAAGHDPQSLALAINATLAEEPTLKSERIQQGLNLVQDYDWPLVANQIYDFYKEALQKKHV